MRSLRLFPLGILASALFCATVAIAQQSAPAIRIVNPIDESQLVILKGNTHPSANAKNDRGAVSPSLPMTDLILVLSRSPEQQAAFEKFVASQYDSNSAYFHKWLTPEQVGANFGPSETDIATISNWLTGHGFTIDEVSKDRMSIRFSGTAGQVESTFHTEIHNLDVKGVAHIGNMSDPQIPAALMPAVVGVKALHNFFPKPLHKLGGKVSLNRSTGKWQRVADAGSAGTNASVSARSMSARAQYGISVPGTSTSNAFQVEDVTPYDFAAMYNVLPLWNASTPINGSGQTIAIAGTSLINASDVANFRSTFGLPAGLPPNQISANSSAVECTSTATNAVCGLSDLTENTLDVELSGAVAPAAQIDLVVSGVTSPTTDTVYSSSHYVIENQGTLKASILSVSYGQCELAEGTAGNVAYYDLWQTAASQGISVFVATGDAGAASCDDGGDLNGNPYSAQYGLSVNGLGSSPYNVSVGGTDLNWCNQDLTTACPASPYWNATNSSTTGASAAGYVPEVPWNDTCSNPLILSLMQTLATQNGASAGSTAESACNFVENDWLTIANNTGIVLAPFIDTVGGGGGASGCVVNDGTNSSSCVSSTTSTGAANGSITLVNDGWPKPSYQINSSIPGLPTSDGVRDLPDVSFFAGNGFLDSSTLICVSAGSQTCVTTPLTGVTVEPTAQEIGGTSVGTPEMAGVMALINQKTGAAQGNPNTELYALAAKQAYSGCSAATVTAGSTSCYFNDVNTGTNAMPCSAGPSGAVEGGATLDPTTGQYMATNTYQGLVSPNCTATTSGDTVGILTGYSAGVGYDQATGLGSLNVANVVNAFVSEVGTAAATIGVVPAVTTVPVNTTLSVTVTVTGTGAQPTGTVSLTAGSYSSGPQTLASGSFTFTIPANTLTVGSNTLNVSYSGDSNYAPSSNDTVTVTATAVAELTPTVSVVPAQTTLDSSASLSVSGAVTGTGGTATGTVVLSGGGFTSPAMTLSNGTYTIVIPGNSLSAGTDTLTVAYTPASGSIYSANSGMATVTVTASAYTVMVTTQPAAIASPGGSATSTVTVTGNNGYAGTVTLSCSTGVGANAGDIDAPTCSVASGSPVTLSSSTTSGTGTFNVTTTSASAELAYPRTGGKGSGWAGAGGGAVLAFLLFLGIPARRRSWRSMMGMLVVMVALGSLAGCGGSGTIATPTGTTPDTYTFTVTATGNPAVTPAPTATFSVTVN